MVDILIQLLGLCLTGVFLTGLVLWFSTRKYREFPGEYGLPVFGNLYYCLLTLNGGITDLMKRCSKVLSDHGDVACLWDGPIIAIAVADPNLIQGLSYHPATVNKEPLVYDKLNDFTRGSFTVSKSDEQWKNYRKLINKSLRKEKLETYHEIFARRSFELVNAMREQSGEFDIQPLALMHAIDILVETNFGLEFHELLERNFKFAKDLMELQHSLANAMSRPSYYLVPTLYLKYKEKRLVGLLDFEKRYSQALMKNVKTREVDSDLSLGEEIILNNTKNNINLKQTLLELRETVFVGGTTTGELISAILLFLAAYPDVQDKVWREQENIFQGSDRLPTSEDLKEMNYLKMVVKETARLTAGPILPRRCTDEAKIGKYTIPANSTVLICSHKLRMDPRYWENPSSFYPEHFLPEKVLARPKCVDVTFGVMPRHCPGAGYTLDMCKFIISSIIRNHKLTTSLKPQDIVLTPVIMMCLQGPYLISCQSRTST